MDTIWRNLLTPGSEELARAEANELAFDRQLAADAALGAKVLEARGIVAPWTAIEKRVAKADIEARVELRSAAPEYDWRVAARKQIESVDLTLDGHVDADAWLVAARARCAEIEVEMRSSSIAGENIVRNLNEVSTRQL